MLLLYREGMDTTISVERYAADGSAIYNPSGTYKDRTGRDADGNVRCVSRASQHDEAVAELEADELSDDEDLVAQ